MKKIRFIFLTMLLLLALVMAQFNGGSGRGDFIVGYSPCTNPTNGGAIAASQTICSGGNPAAFTSTTPTWNTGTLEYKWQSSTTDATTEAGFSDISPTVITETYDPPSGLTTTSWYRWLARVTCMNEGIGCGTSNVVQISVEPTLVSGSLSGSIGRWFLCLSKSLLCGI